MPSFLTRSLLLLAMGCASPSVAGTPPLYGFWGINGYRSPEGLEDLKRRVHLGVFQTASSEPAWTVATLLPLARQAGVKVTLRMTEDHPAYTQDGHFDLGTWQAQVTRWEGSGVQSFIDDGTLVGHMLLDDIDTFDGRDPTAADLDAMAAHSQRILPGLMTYVRQRATRMPVPVGGRYRHVDAIVNQYAAAEGDVGAYATTEAARAHDLGLGVINGLNIADGGDGSSGQPGWRVGKWAMSAAEITRYGTVLARVPACGMFLNWEYDAEERWSDGSLGSDYFQRPELEAALFRLGEVVARHPPVPLMRKR